MKPFRLTLLVLATLLTGFFGCNSGNHLSHRSSAATTAPANPPLALDRQQRRDIEEMKKALYYLASDELEGRGVQTEGLNKAAEFIASTFKSSGLKPLPKLGDYYQPFTINLSAAVGPNTSFTIADSALKLHEDFVPMGLSSEGSFAGGVAFVGYSISNEQFKYDDFANVDVNGKVALALRYEPMEGGKSRFAPDGRSDHATFTAKAKAAAEHGAVALLIVNPPDGSDDDRLMSMQRSGGAKAAIPVLQITREVADSLLAKAEAKPLAEVQREIDSSGEPRSFVLKNVSAAGHVELKRDQREIRNVIAYVPGEGASKDQFIVVGAHYDHLGLGESGSLSMVGKNQIHNGADDNASGTVVMLQLARHFAKKKPARSIIFCAFTGEERGLLGSAQFVNHPPVPLDKIVAMVNLDMVGRLQGNALEVGGTGTAAEFDAIVAAADEASAVNLKPAPSRVGGRGGLGPSDHASFAARKIPVLFVWTGNHIDYHRPTDDAEKINFEGMVRIVEFTGHVIDRLTTMPQTQYVDKFDRSFMGGPVAMRVRLGIMPDYSFDDHGVRVGSTFPNTPAAKGGIRDGDIIVQIGESKVETMEDYMSALNKHNPGETVKVGVMRNSKRMDFDVTLTGRRG